MRLDVEYKWVKWGLPWRPPGPVSLLIRRTLRNKEPLSLLVPSTARDFTPTKVEKKIYKKPRPDVKTLEEL